MCSGKGLTLLWICLIPLYTFAQYDLIVYGATPAGIQASLSAVGEGMQRVLLIHTSNRIGGLMTGGLGATDKGNVSAIGGAALQFFWDVCSAYNVIHPTEPCWNFEPHVALDIFEKMLASKSQQITVLHNTTLVSVSKSDVDATLISSITVAPTTLAEAGPLEEVDVSKTTVYTASYFLDASYEGDLMAAAGVSFVFGRESRDEFNESLAGIMHEPSIYGSHQFSVSVDTRWSNGTLLPMITSAGIPGPVGSRDKKIQAYNFRLCMTQDQSNFRSFPKPANYDSSYWELARRWLKAANITSFNKLMNLVFLGNSKKTDTNNNGPISTDFLGGLSGSWLWPTASPAQRKALWQNHYDYTAGFFWFLQTDPAVPSTVQEQAKTWGLTLDEFVETEGWPQQLYVREARRMHGEYVFTQQDRQYNLSKPDSIGLFSYNIDSHHVQRFVFSSSQPYNEGDFEKFGGPCGQIPYRVITPLRGECHNLVVPVALSATHMGYGALRLEPQFMIIGQSAGVAVAQAWRTKQAVQQVDISVLQACLQRLGQKIDIP